jgi:hypothetical protein
MNPRKPTFRTPSGGEVFSSSDFTYANKPAIAPKSHIPTALITKLEHLYSLGLDIPIEMFDFLDVLIPGAKKYGANNWLNPNGSKSSHKQMHDSIFHHLAKSYSHPLQFIKNPNHPPISLIMALDTGEGGTGKHHLLNAMIRCGMAYTRQVRGIAHQDDEG